MEEPALECNRISIKWFFSGLFKYESASVLEYVYMSARYSTSGQAREK